MNFLHSASMRFALWVALDRIRCVCLVTFWPEQHSPVHFLHWCFWEVGTPYTMVIGFIFSTLTCQQWSQSFVFLTNEKGRNLMFSLSQPFPLRSVINWSVSLAEQQALGLLQPCWTVKCGSLLTLLLHCQAGSVIIYRQSCCWQKWCLFGS